MAQLFRISRIKPNSLFISVLNQRGFCSESKVRVRYAPSPTGYLHLGGLRTALFNYLFAKSHGGKFLLRIEDTDKVVTRQVDGSVQALTKALEWCGIKEDEGPSVGGNCGPYVQSERLHIYKEYATKLIEEGNAYHCFCTTDRLKALRENQTRSGEATKYDRACLHLPRDEVEKRLKENTPHTVRLNVKPGKTTVKDAVKGYVQFCHSDIDDQVLLKSDGFPTYHLANVVDDHLMGISHVIRGEEWLSSTPKHIILYKALGLEPPQFGHLGLLLNSNRSKLSKRQGDVAVEDFQAKGYLPSGLINFVALLGWKPADGSTKEIFTLKELEDEFAMDCVNKSGSIVDIDRLNWINSRHIRMLFPAVFNPEDPAFVESRDLILKLVIPFLFTYNHALKEMFSKDYIYKSLDLMKERVSKFSDFGPLCYYFFTEPDYESQIATEMKQKYWDDDTGKILEETVKRLKDIPDADFNSHTITNLIKQIAKDNNKKMKSVLMPLRYCVSAMEVGAGMGGTLELLGKSVTLQRLSEYK